MSRLNKTTSTLTEYGPLAAITTGHGITHWYNSSIPLLLPFIAADFGLNYAAATLLLTVRSVSQSLFNLPAGAMADMFGRRWLLMGIALIFATIPYFLLGMAPSYGLMLTVMALLGMGNNLWHPAAIPTLVTIYPDRKGLSTAVHSAGAGVGSMLPLLVVGFMLTHMDWRLTIFANAIPGILLLGVAAAFLWLGRSKGFRSGQDEFRRVTGATYLGNLGRLAINGRVVALCLLSGTRSFVRQGVIAMVPFYLTDQMGIAPSYTAIALVVYHLAGLISGPLSGNLSDRLQRRLPVIAGSTLAVSAAMFAMAAVQSPLLFISLLAIVGFFHTAARPVIMAWGLDIAPAELSGSFISLLFMTQSIFGATSPLMAGFIADRWDLTFSLYFLAGAALCCNLMVLLLHYSAEKESRSGSA